VRLIRKLLPYTTIVALIALLYVAWIFTSRWRANRSIEQAKQAESAAANKKITDLYGGAHVKILSFYANPAVVEHGAKALLCFGVANAKSIRIEPGLEPLAPSMSRCIEVAPKHDTAYTLTAQDAGGQVVTQSCVLRVK
jgi:hypothetical protein